MDQEISRIIDKFSMKPHPEGGYFGAGFRSPEFLRSESLPNRYGTPRNMYSSIYFMVTRDKHSRFHRLKTDEMWHYYAGDPMILHLISETGKYSQVILSNTNGHEKFLTLVKRNTWMAASTRGEDKGYALVGCTLAPGFEYKDFELGDRQEMIEAYPDCKDVIEQFT